LVEGKILLPARYEARKLDGGLDLPTSQITHRVAVYYLVMRIRETVTRTLLFPSSYGQRPHNTLIRIIAGATFVGLHIGCEVAVK
jgi:hypothetical protein